MQRRIWTVEELAQILIATNEANVNTDFLAASGSLKPEEKALARAYREGFKSALTCVALAVGIPVTTPDAQDRESSSHHRNPKVTLLPAD